MDFELAEEHRIFRDSLRKFLEAELRPLDDRWGDQEMTPERARQLSRMLVPWGYLGANRSEDPFINCIQTEELARVFPSAAGIVGTEADVAKDETLTTDKGLKALCRSHFSTAPKG